MLSPKTTSGLETDILVVGLNYQMRESVKRLLDPVYKVRSPQGIKNDRAQLFGKILMLKKLPSKKLKIANLDHFFKFSYLVLNYVPLMLRMVLFMHLYCKQKFYTNIQVNKNFAPKILQYAFSETKYNDTLYEI